LTKAKIPKQVSLSREDSLGSQMSKPHLLKRKWSEDMTRNVRAHGSRYAKKVCEAVAKARGENVALKLRNKESGHLLGGLKLRK
jgi:hypothetical protein